MLRDESVYDQCIPCVGQSRLKRGRYSDPGGQKEKDPESELESLIMRVGEKVIYCYQPCMVAAESVTQLSHLTKLFLVVD